MWYELQHTENNYGHEMFYKGSVNNPYNGASITKSHTGTIISYAKYKDGYCVSSWSVEEYGSRYQSYEEVHQDSVISISEMRNVSKDGLLLQKTIVYQKDSNRYKMVYEYSIPGELTRAYRERFFYKTDYEVKDDGPNSFDKDGYSYNSELDGPWLEYTNGSYNASSFSILTGQYVHGKKTGTWTRKYENGNIYSIEIYLEDHPDGTWFTYSEDGEKFTESNYAKGFKEGIWKNWYRNGQVAIDSKYHFGELVGDYTEYYENGKTKKKCKYVAGIYDGKVETWYENGQKESEYTTVRNNIQGIWREWYSNGQVKLERGFKNGGPTGYDYEWYENGQLKSQSYIDAKGVVSDSSRTWFENGQVETVVGRNKTGKILVVKSSYANGKMKSEIPYANGKINGVCSYWNEKGILIKQISMKDNVPNGEYKTWNDTGKHLLDYNYSMNVRNGNCKRWDTTGNLVLDRNYENGKPLDFKIPSAPTLKANCFPDPSTPFSSCDTILQFFRNQALAVLSGGPWHTDSLYMDSVIITESMINKVVLSLLSVYNSNATDSINRKYFYYNPKSLSTNSEPIYFTFQDSMGFKYINVLENWEKGISQTGIPAIDSIISKYKLKISSKDVSNNGNGPTYSAAFTSDYPLNVFALNREFQKVSNRISCTGYYPSFYELQDNGTNKNEDVYYNYSQYFCKRMNNYSQVTVIPSHYGIDFGTPHIQISLTFNVYDDGEVDNISAYYFPYLRGY
jgi:antitoxin component YwqK of YwqJK toxin-antitoxin module